METSLVVMAAGIGSRFGKGIKQLEPVGPGGEIIMDYSIHDALEAGFDRVVFIIRHDLEADFHEIIGKRIEKICPIAYAFQEKDRLPAGFSCSPDRKKPWGTGHAVLSCKGIVNEPFLVINADDYYGKTSFRVTHDFLVANSGKPNAFCMPGFILKNTLSDHGSVTRGVCRVSKDGWLQSIEETGGLVRDGDGAAIETANGRTPTDPDAVVSMNMWALTPSFFDELEKNFPAFLSSLQPGDIKSEFLLPQQIDCMIQNKTATVKVLSTPDRWFGVTYHEDKQIVTDSFRALHEAGVYHEPLYQ